MENEIPKYRLNCTLTFGDIYGQIIVWLIVIFISLATTVALWSSTQQAYAFLAVGIILVVSLPFLLFAFVTTLLNHIEFVPEMEDKKNKNLSLDTPRVTQKPATSAG
ncbi:hypothetical protein PN462_09720 [Spirulina sp. CS-785/01]|uniref:hypothetical protein n=1 Tax=Spirulina sp. CS-785/01 TaxID=3021716 RepID=UPI00232EC8BD|nr:hypothetical protein [Spirulina sp. CS-785/01]MDB9313376.1 hypothetical protein [Spirulina sp. CS-785/01]